MNSTKFLSTKSILVIYFWFKSQNAPIVNDNHTPATLDVLIVNVIRGTLLPKAHVWVLGRQAAVSRIPSNLFDAVTEIKGFKYVMRCFILD